MRDPGCEDVRAWLAVRDGTAPQAVTRHLATCEACRLESGRLDRVVGWLASGAALDPPEALDRAVRALLRRPARPTPFARPAMAAALAACAMLALLASLSIALAQAGAAESGPTVALGALAVYLAVSAAAALPLLLDARRRGAPGAGGLLR